MPAPDDVESLPDAPQPVSENGPEAHTDSLASVVSNSDSQPLEALQYSAAAVPQPSVESPESPFLATLGSILLNTEFWTVGERIPESQTRQTPNYPDHLSDLEFHWPVLHVDQPIHLSPSEIAIFRNYVENVSRWVRAPSPVPKTPKFLFLRGEAHAHRTPRLTPSLMIFPSAGSCQYGLYGVRYYYTRA